MNARFPTRSFVWPAAGLLLFAAAEFVGAQAVGSGPATTMPAATRLDQIADDQLKPAAEAAWAVFQALRDYVHASQTLDNPKRRAEDLAKARRQILSLITMQPSAEEELPTYVSLWPAVIARYVDGLERDRMTLVSADQHVVVMAVAANPQDKETYDRLYRELTAELQEQGYSGDDLESVRRVRLQRELARRGIGYPVAATILLTMRKIDGCWKADRLDLRPPRLPTPGSQPASGPAIVTLPPAKAMGRPQTQPAK